MKPSTKPRTKPTRKAARPSAPAARTSRAFAPPARATSSLSIGDVSIEALRELAAIVHDHGLTRLSLSQGGVDVTIRRDEPLPPGGPTMVVASQPTSAHVAPPAAVAVVPVDAPAAPAVAVPATEAGPTISSPFVGTFYRSPSPEAPNFVEVGQRVKKGQVLCIVEAMKLMNEIEAEHDGTISQVLVDNAQSVEYGQALFRLSAEA